MFRTIDYHRGIDVWRYNGDTYVPADDGSPNPTPRTGGPGAGSADAPACASAADFRFASATGSGSGVRFTVNKERLVARFSNRTSSFACASR